MDFNQIMVLKTYMDSEPNTYLFPLVAKRYLEDEEYDKAEEVCKLGLSVHPELPEGHFACGMVKLSRGNVRDGLEYMKSCIRFDPGFVNAYYKLVTYGADIFTKAELIKYYNTIARLNPSDRDVPYKIKALVDAAEEQVAENTEAASELENTFDFDADSIPDFSDLDLTGNETIQEAETAMAELEQNQLQEPTGVTEPELQEPDIPEFAEESAHFGPLMTEDSEGSIDDLPGFDDVDSLLPFDEEPAETNRLAEESDTDDEPEWQNESFGFGDAEPAEDSSGVLDKKNEPVKDAAEESVIEEDSSLKSMFDSLNSNFLLDESGDTDWADKVEFNEDNFTLNTENESTEIKTEASKPEIKITEEIPGINLTESEPAKPTVDSTLNIQPVDEQVMEESGQKVDTDYTLDAEFGAAEKENENIELKIPIPTLTFVEVLKKQKLYDQALQIVDALEEKTTDKESLKTVRDEILELKAKEEAAANSDLTIQIQD